MTKSTHRGAQGRAILASISLTAALSGCADLSGIGGTSQFACKAPAGVQCNSVSGVYANALQNNLPSQRAERAKHEPAQAAPAAVLPATAPVAEGLEAHMLRSRPRVMRLWVNAWEDQDSDMVDQSYVYLQIDPGRWLVEHAQSRTRATFAPLRAAVSDAPPAQANEPAPAPTPAPQVPVPMAPAAQADEPPATPVN